MSSKSDPSFFGNLRSAIYSNDKYTLARLFPRLSDVELAYALVHDGDLVLRAWAWSGTISWLRDQEEWVRHMWRLIQMLPEKLNFTFACDCAERALHREREQGREPHPDSWNAPKVRRTWLRGEASDEELSAAKSAADIVANRAANRAARSAIGNAAWSTADSAAWSAARSAAWSAARSKARSAAWSTAGGAAWSAADSAARSAANRAAGSTAGSAAYGAAKAEERLWQMAHLATLMENWDVK